MGLYNGTISEQCHRQPRGTALTLTTEAVRPAAEDDLPEVYTARGRKLATYLSICDLAQEGSPTMATLMSPLRLMPCTNAGRMIPELLAEADGTQPAANPFTIPCASLHVSL